MFWKSEIDFPCVQPIRIAKEHERVQGEKKKETFFLKKNLILSWFTNARDKFSILESFSLNALGFLWTVFKIKREKNRRQKSIEGYDKPQRTWMYLCLMTAIVANKCIYPSLFMVGEICLVTTLLPERCEINEHIVTTDIQLAVLTRQLAKLP